MKQNIFPVPSGIDETPPVAKSPAKESSTLKMCDSGAAGERMTRKRMAYRLTKHREKIASLTLQLAREKQVNKALSKLAFAATQDPERLRQMRRAVTLRKIAKPRKMKEAA